MDQSESAGSSPVPSPVPPLAAPPVVAPPIFGASPPVVAPPVFQPPASASSHSALKKALGSLGVVGVLLLKFLGKLKFIILPVLKFLPAILKTGGTMLLTIWVYAMAFGFWFAVGFVLLIFVHESGH